MTEETPGDLKPAPNPTWTSKATSLSTEPAQTRLAAESTSASGEAWSQASPRRGLILSVASLPQLQAGEEGVSGMKLSLCLSFAGFECRVPGQSPDPARLPRLQQPRFPYNRLSFTSPFFRCIL